MYCYYRLGLVTGLVEIPELIAWADEQILISSVPPSELIDLSLSARLPHSQILRLLNQFQGAPQYDLPLALLFQRAAALLAAEPGRAVPILQGLRLLDAEEYLPPHLRPQIRRLDECLQGYRQGRLAAPELHQTLQEFLDPYHG
jgi:hypothetical protein